MIGTGLWMMYHGVTDPRVDSRQPSSCPSIFSKIVDKNSRAESWFCGSGK